MNCKLFFGFMLLLFLGLTACTQKAKTEQEQILETITNLETQVQKADPSKPDSKLSTDLVNAYQDYAFRFPEDSLAAKQLFKAASIMRTNGETQAVISTYNELISKYPNFEKLPECYFLKADVYHSQLKDFVKATEAYQAFLAKYPTHTFAKDVPHMIQACSKGMTLETYFEQEVLAKKQTSAPANAK